MMRDTWNRLAPLTGVVAAGALFSSFWFGGSSPDTDASPAKVAAYFTAHHQGQKAAALVLVYGALFALFFGAALRSRLRSAGSDGPAALAFGGIVLFAVGVTTFAGLTFALADVPSKIDPTALQALNVLNNDMFFAFLAGMAAFMLGNGLAIVRSRVLPRWLGWAAIMIGVVAATPAGWFAFFGFLGWTPIVSVLLVVREREPAGATAAAAVTG
jgi:hypothetical protein